MTAGRTILATRLPCQGELQSCGRWPSKLTVLTRQRGRGWPAGGAHTGQVQQRRRHALKGRRRLFKVASIAARREVGTFKLTAPAARAGKKKILDIVRTRSGWRMQISGCRE